MSPLRVLLACALLAACGPPPCPGLPGTPPVHHGERAEGIDWDAFDAFVIQELEAACVPGLSVAMVDAQGTHFSAAYGWANLEEEVPLTVDTPFMVASASNPAAPVCAGRGPMTRALAALGAASLAVLSGSSVARAAAPDVPMTPVLAPASAGTAAPGTAQAGAGFALGWTGDLRSGLVAGGRWWPVKRLLVAGDVQTGVADLSCVSCTGALGRVSVRANALEWEPLRPGIVGQAAGTVGLGPTLSHRYLRHGSWMSGEVVWAEEGPVLRVQVGRVS